MSSFLDDHHIDDGTCEVCKKAAEHIEGGITERKFCNNCYNAYQLGNSFDSKILRHFLYLKADILMAIVKYVKKPQNTLKVV